MLRGGKIKIDFRKIIFENRIHVFFLFFNFYGQFMVLMPLVQTIIMFGGINSSLDKNVKKGNT